MNRSAALALDSKDSLAALRSSFELPCDQIYLDGNSLGALPSCVPERLRHAVEQEWGRGLIRSWNSSWFGASERVARRLAPLLGAHPDEVEVADSTSVNLFKQLASALHARPGRPRILIDADAFPTNLYMSDSAARWLDGHHFVDRVPAEQLFAKLGDDVAVVVLSHVDYRSGRLHPLAELTRAAHTVGALILVDLSHSAGTMPLELTDWAVDLAVGCGYKFLCGGPGAPAYLYVRRPLQVGLEQPLTGWFGHARPFDFEPGFDPAEGMARMRCGTPPVLSLLALEAALEVFDEVDLQALRQKAIGLSELLIRLVCERCGRYGIELGSPLDPALRGSQVSFRHPDAFPIVQALISQGVIGDFRAPDTLRFGITPLYTRFIDVWEAASRLSDVLERDEWKRFPREPEQTVT